ncbi:MAG: twin arginine-targeting protein translocase TatB [Betaproteobacteria bacterium RIFCSPLOWO2_12_FULL_65_14]|nr:MAG: twin arginine-targeting protein translocase TatB [Betaproteobacteria bacterium RIFCSPLOWO2_12_FULL_65_14]
MFDVGFSELMVIAVVALIVIGPERLPKVARTLGNLLGRLQRYVNDVKADINREMELDSLRNFKQEFESAAQSVESGIRDEFNKTESALNSIASQFDPNAEPAADATSGETKDAASGSEDATREPGSGLARPAPTAPGAGASDQLELSLGPAAASAAETPAQQKSAA